MLHVPDPFTTLKLIESPNNSLCSPIYTLNDDVLLNIFYLYRLHIRDEESGQAHLIIYYWKRQRWWYSLAQVSRRWRNLILASRSILDLHLICTYGVPVADMLAHSPPFPLTVFYIDRHRKMTAEDEEGAMLALSHRDRVRHIAIKMPALELGKFITVMDEEFPILERLFMSSLTKEETSLTIPVTFRAPNLRRFDLWYTALPIRSPLFTSTAGLVFLWLGGIPRSAYFPPTYLLTRLSLMPQLERLGIGFHSPPPNSDVVSQLLFIPIITQVTLPNLRLISFRGVSAYLECLLARISTPVFGMLEVGFFDQLTFPVPHLLQFVQTS